MKILIISGFLGAGKTTFIKELIKRTEQRFVVLENEYGNTNVDQQMIKSEDQADVWDLTEGCICCTKSADLNASVMTIESTLEPEYLIVEPSGVGALSNVIRNLQKIEYERITLLRPVTIVDADHFAHDCEEFADIYQDQIRTAGTVMISKPETPDTALYAQVEAKVHEMNPEAYVLPCHYTKMDQEWWDSLLTTSYSGESIKQVEDSSIDLETYTVYNCRMVSPVALLWLLERVIRGYFGQIIRAKGILPAGKEWVRFDVVNGKVAITGFDESTENAKAECVWIGRAIDRLALRDYLWDPDSPLAKRRARMKQVKAKKKQQSTPPEENPS